MKDVQFYELFGGIALKNHAFSFCVILPLSFVNAFCLRALSLGY